MSNQPKKYETQNIANSTEESDAFDIVTIPVPSEEPQESDQTEEHESGIEQFSESHAIHVEEQSDRSFSSLEPDSEQLMKEVISPRQVSYTPQHHEKQYAMQSPNDDSLAFLDKIKAIKESLQESMEDSLATVKVVLIPVGQEIVISFKVDTVLKYLKDYFSHLLGIPLSVLQIRYSGLDRYQQVAVEIVKSDFHKPFLGGFRHKVTGVEYHHAGTQTVPKKIPERLSVFCRDTQTVFQKKNLQQTTNTTSTQMTNIGVYVSNMTDKLVTPGKYFSAAEYHAQRLKAVIVIQTYYRQWHAKIFVEDLRRQKSLRLEWETQQELRKIREKEEWVKLDYHRRHNPKTSEDFEFLYNALEFWRQEELKRINQSFTGAERKAALCELLEKETQIIASIGRHRYIAYTANQEAAIQAFLDKEHECKLTQEILELIDREVDLMMRGVKHHNLEGLRKRIATLFFHYIKTPLFNPEVAKYLKVPQDPLKFYKKIYFCHSCQLYLPSTEFSISSTSRRIYRCRNCISLENEAQKRESFLKYRCLLQQLYFTEADYEDDSKIAFLMQLQDIQYLTENIWASQSVLSAWDDLSDLVMVRWNKSLEWSPWNCILLTKDEAAAHLNLTSIEEGYERSFIHKIKHKHILAKNYFSQIPVLASFILDDPEIDEIRWKHHSDTTPKIIESQRPPP
ncbi:IQ motif and ubiquitin-like domain-containing protein isoform X5 [Macaca fascicularis]|uniref:IQ motif and ubiquitin-like domain-containing protein isoform X5 n=1 Tax=Macaca fascicularis TaxID=9541 RepID=UPI003D15AE69